MDSFDVYPHQVSADAYTVSVWIAKNYGVGLAYEVGFIGMLGVLHATHYDNSQMRYFAEQDSCRILVIPVTPIVDEFRLFNSLLQVDWEASFQPENTVLHPEEYPVSKQQKALLEYVKDFAGKYRCPVDPERWEATLRTNNNV